MPTLVAPCVAVSQVDSGLGNDSVWVVPAGALASADGTAASVDPFFDTDGLGNPAPPAPDVLSNAGRGKALALSFDLSGMPSGQTATAVRLVVRRMKGPESEGGAGVCDLTARLSLSGAPVGADLASASQWPTAYADASYSWTPGSGGVPAILSADVPNLAATFDAKGTGEPFLLPFVLDGRPHALVDRARLEIDYAPFAPVATRPANRGPRRIPPYRHGL